MCKLVRILYALVPLKRLRAYLIRSHLEVCRNCRPDIGETEGWAGLVQPPAWISREPGHWPQIERRMREQARVESARRSAPVRRPSAELAVAAGGVLAIAVLAVLLGKHPPRGTGTRDAAALRAPRVEILAAEIGGRPARSSVYQTKGASFIWFSPMPRKEG